MREKAWFVFEPRRVEDLALGRCKGKWIEYNVVKTLCLNKVDYKNFSTDLLADRQFIEDNAALCQKPGDCLLITTRRHTGEILVIPWHSCYIRYAALRLPIQICKSFYVT